MERRIFLTGKPGVGKTSVLLRVVNILKTKGLKIGGMISREFRERGVRIGFEIMDIKNGRTRWLAHVNQATGPRIGKYRVNLNDLKTIGVTSILNAIRDADVMVLDEIGPMELLLSSFKKAVIMGIKSKKTIIGTIHYKTKNSLINTVKEEVNVEIIEVTPENRKYLHSVIVKSLCSLII